MPGAVAERDPTVGRSVNLDSTLNLLEACQHLPHTSRFVYASSIGVYGNIERQGASEDTAPSPDITYGAHKLACEIPLADASRRGWMPARCDYQASWPDGMRTQG